jgi:carboxypeptidase Taq
MADAQKLYADYKSQMQKIADIKYASAVLQWDQETYLPPAGNEMRGQQLATLSELAHRYFVDDQLGNLLNELNGLDGLDKSQQRNVELSLEDYTKSKKLSSEFVRKMTETVNKSFYAWVDARKKNDFKVFEKPLDDLLILKRQEAELLGYTDHPYNALLNDFEKGCTVNMLDEAFGKIKEPLKDLLAKIMQQKAPDDSFMHQHFDKDAQMKWGHEIVEIMHFDTNAGRQDISVHPFTTSFNAKDVRITTRIDENDFSNMSFSCMHETGHALYEQGLPFDQYGLPLGEAASLSIHESQSRLWENCLGRNLPFWQHHFPALQKHFPEQLKNVDAEKFYKAINLVQPSFVRTEADELTYHFHVLIRYEVEKQLIGGQLATKDIPAFWNEQYAQMLGVTVKDDLTGCLQDVHWSHGSFGYFPTYSLGSMYAAQLFETVKKAVPNLENEISKGNTQPLLAWLRQHIHVHGRMFNSEQLCTLATGSGLDSRIFIQYLKNKYEKVYV